MKRERNGEECYGEERNKRLEKVKKKREQGESSGVGGRGVVQVQ